MLDKEGMKNYHPISNLPFISKLTESAYCGGHSTEIALLKVQSDIADALDEGTITALIMLGLSIDLFDRTYLQVHK